MRILSFGEILWDVYPDKKYLGGAPLNFAAHLAKHGHDVYMLSALGQDKLGADALIKLKEWNVQSDYITISTNKPTGRCIVTLDENSIPTYELMQDVAYDYIDNISLGNKFNVLYFGTLSLRSVHNLASLKSLIRSNEFSEVFVDVNLREPFYSVDTVSFSIKNATILKVSLEELPVVSKILGMPNITNYKLFAKKVSEIYTNIKLVIITLGSEGAYTLNCVEGTDYQCDGITVDVVSTVGAGDSFSAAFLHQYMCGKGIQFCIEYATKIASYVVSKKDAVPEYEI